MEMTAYLQTTYRNDNLDTILKKSGMTDGIHLRYLSQIYRGINLVFGINSIMIISFCNV